jgi:phage portal protein BeeE
MSRRRNKNRTVARRMSGSEVAVAERSVIDVQKDRKAGPTSLDRGTAAATFGWDGKVPIQNARVYRHWAKTSEWVRGAVNIRKTQVSSAEWDIVPFDQRQRYSKRLAADIKSMMTTPNPANDSFRTFIEPVVEDLLTLDAGCVEKERTLGGDLVHLWPVNAEYVRVDAMWEGNPNTARYLWYPNGFKATERWINDDFIYMMANPRTDTPVGLPPLETLRNAVEAELSAHEYNVRQVANAAPDGIINLGEGFSEAQVNRFREFFESEVAGRGPLGFIGGSKDPGFIKFRDSNRDQQFLEWQIYLVRKIAVVFGLTPQDLGVTFDVNRSTSEIQLQVSEDRGLRPLMSLMQEYLTEEVVWDRTFGGPANNLAFRFTALNLKESTAKAAIYEKALAGVPWRFINEARIDEGREPIPDMEGKLIMATPQGAVDISDVPTVRELLEMQQAAKAAPPSNAERSFGEDFVLEMADKLRDVLVARSSEPPAEIHIDKGAFEVNVPAAPVSINEGAVQVRVGVPEAERIIDPVISEAIAQMQAQVAGLEEAVRSIPTPPGPSSIVIEAAEPPEVSLDTDWVAKELQQLRASLASSPVASVVRKEVIRDDAGRIVKVLEHRSDGSAVTRVVKRDERGRITEVLDS